MSDNEKIVSIGSARAEESGNCKDWTSLEALRETVNELESGDMEMEAIVILGWAKNRDKKSEFFQRFAGVNHETVTAMLALAQHNNLVSWK